VHLVSFVEHADHVCCRYRLRAFEPALCAAGHTLEYRPHPRGWWQAVGAKTPAADICIIQRHLPSAWELRLLGRQYPHLIFDFDDAVWLRDSFSPRGLHSPRRARRFRTVVQAVDQVIAGSQFLADYAAQFADTVRVIPTCLEPSQYPTADHRSPAAIDLVWIGSSSTLRGLERIAPMLDAIGAAVRGTRLKLICDRSLPLMTLPVTWRRWSEETERSELSLADIGIAWVPDDDWSRGKCGLKVLQYMAAGLPVVANPVGVHLGLVRHGETGFLAETTAQWIAAVRILAANPGLRARMGRAGRALVEREYSVACGAEAWLGILDSPASVRVAA
jgi:glycosyltransferase involved in cell wall biosynthesis